MQEEIEEASKGRASTDLVSGAGRTDKKEGMEKNIVHSVCCVRVIAFGRLILSAHSNKGKKSSTKFLFERTLREIVN